MELYEKRFTELEIDMINIEKTKSHYNGEFSEFDFVDSELLDKWIVKTKSLIENLCTIDSIYFKDFIKAAELGNYESNWDIFKRV